MDKEYKLFEKKMDSSEISDFVNCSFKYTFLNESDAMKISKENPTKLVRFGDELEYGRMKYASMKHGKANPFIGEVHSAFKADTWLKYSDEYKKAIKDLADMADNKNVKLSLELYDLSNYLLPRKKENKDEK